MKFIKLTVEEQEITSAVGNKAFTLPEHITLIPVENIIQVFENKNLKSGLVTCVSVIFKYSQATEEILVKESIHEINRLLNK